LQDIANGRSNVDKKGKRVIQQVTEGRNEDQHKGKQKNEA
jgi:hypothetical protein